MDDLLREFLTESAEHLDTVDAELVRFEQDPNNQTILRNIFRLVHTIKGTCGFLGLPRLEALAHAAETLMGRFRDGYPVSAGSVTLILATLDRLKAILGDLEATGSEPEGSDDDLIEALERLSQGPAEPAPAPKPAAAAPVAEMQLQIVERELKPGEVSLDELERAFREAPGPEDEPAAPVSAPAPVAAAPSPAVVAPTEPKAETKPAKAEGKPEPRPAEAGKETAKAEAPEGEAAKAGRTIRVNVETLEHLMTMVSELVLTRNQLLEIARRHEDSSYKVPLQRLSHVTAELQDGVMKTRMQPIGNAWQKLPRVVRDLSAELSKGIELVMAGAETELDRQVLDLIKDPLTHMVRNSADHGIEPTGERIRAGKPAAGTIRLSAYHEGGTITIEIADDGRGLDLAAIRRKAVERGIAGPGEVERMTDAEVAKFIFHAGFSTAQAVTSVSGRGVGMDVVKTNIEAIGGLIDIATQRGQGTTFTIKIPLTLAIISALIVRAGGQRYAVPQIAVLELVRVEPKGTHRVESINGAPVLRLRERLLPITTLAVLMGGARDAEAAMPETGFVVVAQVGRQRFGILVDEVFHTEEIVVKPMSSKLRHLPLFAGNTILGDGAVVLIVDPNGIARTIGQGAAAGAGTTEAEEAREGTEAKATLLVFKGGGSFKAVPLSLVTRIEEIDAGKIEHLGGRPLIQYRGRLMPLVPADPAIAIRSHGPQALVVFSDEERAMGLVVDEIVDIVEERLDIEIAADRSDLIGSAVLRGRATDIIDVAHFLPLAYDDWARGPRKVENAKPGLLLVDDSAFFRDLLSPVLKAAGYEVGTAGSAEEALARLKADPRLGVVVADLEMPGRSGFDLVAAMRGAGGRLAGLPVVALSGQVGPETVARARALAISDLVAKFDRSGLVAALAEIGAAKLDKAA